MAPVRYISQVIGAGRPNQPDGAVVASYAFDNRRDYRRSTVGVGRNIRSQLGVEPGDFIVVEYNGPPVERHPRAGPASPLYLCVQRMPRELIEPDSVTLSSDARQIMGVPEVDQIDREMFSTVFGGVKISKAM